MMSVCDRPSPDLLSGTPGYSRPRARTSGGRTRGSSRCSRKPLRTRGDGWWEKRRGLGFCCGVWWFRLGVVVADEAVLG
jgi:hypothetical protein